MYDFYLLRQALPMFAGFLLYRNCLDMQHPRYEDERLEIFSHHLHRYKVADIFLPPHFSTHKKYPVIFMNDGQDARQLRLREVLKDLYRQQLLQPLVVVAIHASARMKEYGSVACPDFAGRGNRAAAYMAFVTKELYPLVQKQFCIDPRPAQHAFIGMSLGGVSAVDIVWHHPEKFGKAGVFSGSFWWRSRDIGPGYSPADRIMHRVVANSEKRQGLKFWLQVGTEDETSDRNNSGIIDAIEDTLDFVQMLRYKGYQLHRDIRYVEITGGKHDQQTWSVALPNFLLWAFSAEQARQKSTTA